MSRRREAEKIFGDFYREKLISWGFQEGMVDRRVFFGLTPGPLPQKLAIALGVHVDDSLALVADKPTYEDFQLQ